MIVLNDTKFLEWKEKMKPKLMALGSNFWNLVCNGCTQIPPLGEEFQNNGQALNVMYCFLSESKFEKVMHYETAKEVWDNLQVIHEG